MLVTRRRGDSEKVNDGIQCFCSQNKKLSISSFFVEDDKRNTYNYVSIYTTIYVQFYEYLYYGILTILWVGITWFRENKW